MTTNAQSWDASSASRRSIAGAGLGLRWGDQGWNVESTLAGRLRGGASVTEASSSPVRWFLTVSKRFE
jgi:hemolysin activation/secretion protein